MLELRTGVNKLSVDDIRMWTVPTELITICETDPVISCEIWHMVRTGGVLHDFYNHTEGRGGWIGRRLQVHPPPVNDRLPATLARDDTGCVWILTSPTTATNKHEVLDIDVMFHRYVLEEYSQQVQDDLRYREKCVNGVYVSSPDLHQASDDDVDE